MPATGAATVVERGNCPAIRAAAGPSRDAEAVGIHFRTRAKIVERPDAVPGLDAGGRVTARVPPPHGFFVSAVVNAWDFAELQRIDDQADVTVLREPHAVMLVGDFVSVADAVLDDRSVAADVENRGRRLTQLFRQIKVRRDVQSWQRLEVEFLDNE
jgi:hypothetical protein